MVHFQYTSSIRMLVGNSDLLNTTSRPSGLFIQGGVGGHKFLLDCRHSSWFLHSE